MKEITLSRSDCFGVRTLRWTDTEGRRCAAAYRSLTAAWLCLLALRSGDSSLLRY